MPPRRTESSSSGSSRLRYAMVLVLAALLWSMVTLLSTLGSHPSDARRPPQSIASDEPRLQSLQAPLQRADAILRRTAAAMEALRPPERAPKRELRGPDVVESASGPESTAPTIGPLSQQRAVAPHSRDVVLGLAHNTLPPNLAIFLGSFRRHNPEAALVLWINTPLHPRTRSLLQRFGAHALLYDPREDFPAAWASYHPSTVRWPLFQAYLERHRQQIDHVLMVDVRDTAFQADPFAKLRAASPAPPPLWVVEEAERISVSGWNRDWIRDCFGPQVVSEVSQKTVLCSGVSIGGVDAALAYLGEMVGVMEKPSFPACERNGVDQGIHNVVLHRGDVPPAQVRIDNQHRGWIAHMQSRLATIRISGEERVVTNSAGEAMAVVHQFDRYDELARQYTRMFVDWDIAEDKYCEGFALRHDEDLFYQRCDMGKTGEISSYTCCASCAMRPGCQGWTFQGGCWLKDCSIGGQGSGVVGRRMTGAISGYRTQAS